LFEVGSESLNCTQVNFRIHILILSRNQFILLAKLVIDICNAKSTGWKVWVLNPDMGKGIFSYPKFHTACGAHPTPYKMGTGDKGVKA
jgi:hypothetical protein